MRIDDFPELPNGLHDACLLGIALDVEACRVRLDVDAWVGDLSGPEDQHETRLLCSITVSGLCFFSLEPPDPRYVSTPAPGMIDAGLGMAPLSRVTVPPLPADASLNWIFLSSKNCFVHLAGTDAKLELVGIPKP